ncbi:MAG: hypothetical protein V5A52_04665 [Halovenus sp.]
MFRAPFGIQDVFAAAALLPGADWRRSAPRCSTRESAVELQHAKSWARECIADWQGRPVVVLTESRTATPRRASKETVLTTDLPIRTLTLGKLYFNTIKILI